MATIKEQFANNELAHYDLRKGVFTDQSVNNLGEPILIRDDPYFAGGTQGNSIRFNGFDSLIQLSNDSSLNHGGIFTTMCWFRHAHDDFNQTPFGQVVGGSEGWTTYQNLGTIYGFFVYNFDDDLAVVLNSYPIDSWVQVVAVSTSTETKIYQNGTLAQIATKGAGAYVHPSLNPLAMSSYRTVDIGLPPPAGAAAFFDGAVQQAILWDVVFTDAQIAQLFQETNNEGFIGEFQKRNIQLPELLAFNNFEKDLGWTKGTGWTIANGNANSDGSQVSTSDLSQSVLEIGKIYSIQYELRNRTAGTITALAGTNSGTARNVDGVFNEFLQATGTTNFILQADVDFVGDIAWVRVGEGPRLTYRNTVEDTPVTVLDLTSGDIADWRIASGTWAITDDGTDRWIENEATGNLNIPSLQAFGTWQFDIHKTGATDQINLQFVASDTTVLGTSGQDGYFFQFDGNEAIRISRATGGAFANVMVSSLGFLVLATKYSIRITRDYTGEFTMYVRGGAFTDWTLADSSQAGTNPGTDTTHTTSQFFNSGLVGGDSKITNFKFFEGVVDPITFPDL